MTTISVSTIFFPEIQLPTRSAHQLRGYFGHLFKEHSPLLHNHFEDGRLRYSYPLVQYKIVDGTPVITGIKEGAQLLIDLFLQIKELQIFERTFPLHQKNAQVKNREVGVTDVLHTYRFSTLWMALNQENYSEYLRKDKEGQKAQLNRILTSNILSFFKGIGLFLEQEERIMLTVQTQEKSTKFKDKRMLAFTGQFTTNVLLPDFIGLGKSVSRGFGTINRI